MKKIYTIFIYNYKLRKWDQVFQTDSDKLAKVKYRQLVLTYQYHNYVLREEVVLVG